MHSQAVKCRSQGFTLVEMLVALMVTSIVVTVVATLAYALGVANDGSSEKAHQQMQLRYATFRLSELIGRCRLVCAASDDEIAVWRSDDNWDGKINPGELVYIQAHTPNGRIRVFEFASGRSLIARNWFKSESFKIRDIKSGLARIVLVGLCRQSHTDLVTQCRNIRFLPDAPAPHTRLVNIVIDLPESQAARHYQITSSLKAWAGNLLDSSGEIVSTDDD
jgi:prepilin-type N-terminal cleavage/methylation domain-containing protein